MAAITIQLDEMDMRHLQQAIAAHQRLKPHVNRKTLPKIGQSDIRGTILGEIARDWLESQGIELEYGK